jgi:hypothetical protein
MPAEIIDLAFHLRSRRLRGAIDDLNLRLVEDELPTPEELGWAVIDRDAEGHPTKVCCARYSAMAGYVPGEPDLVFLDFRHSNRRYAMSLEELLIGLESGFLPDPVTD